MLSIAVTRSALPSHESRLAFIEHYAAYSSKRLVTLERQPDDWLRAHLVL